MEQFVAKVFGGGKVTVPKRLRELLGVGDGDYVQMWWRWSGGRVRAREA